MKKQVEENIKKIFYNWANEESLQIIPLPQSGSYRQYFRVKSMNKTAIAVYNEDKKENIAFVKFSEHFEAKNLPVPKIYLTDMDNYIYLQEDLEDTTLFSYINQNRKGPEFSDELTSIFKKVLEQLIRFQIKGAEEFNYDYCYPRAAFDKQSMMWDLNYFKYYFLKLAKIPYDEQNLENDFLKFSDFLLTADNQYFLYRDFQTRNIMIKNRKPYFIDYQGGRQGALQYDLASLLYDAKADVPQEIRNELANYYLDMLSKYIKVDKGKFKKYYKAFVLIRIMQAMGAFGFRGFYEKKTHFLQSIPYAIQNLEYLLKTIDFVEDFPELTKVLSLLTQSEELQKFINPRKRLKVSIISFSYKKGIPKDMHGNGGGFIFDCRAIHNPGKYEKYFEFTGRDVEVKEFFDQEDEMYQFLDNVYRIVDQSVEKYLKRRFTNLMVGFGCTGGQHRSVYSSEKLASYLKKYDIDIEVEHRELDLMA